MKFSLTAVKCVIEFTIEGGHDGCLEVLDERDNNYLCIARIYLGIVDRNGNVGIEKIVRGVNALCVYLLFFVF